VGRSVLIVNPFASGVTEERIRLVRAALPGDPDVRLTDRSGHATQLARDALADGAGVMYVFSGDGGFNEVLNGVDGSTPIGFIPGGGTSVLPRALGLPRDPVAAARQLGRGTVRRISLGRVNGRRFGFCAGIGFDAELVRRVDARGRRPDGRRPGDLAFAWSALRLVAERRGRFDSAVEIQGRGRAAFALIANCDPYSYAGRIPLRAAPLARFELGLDLVAPRSVKARNIPGFAFSLVRGRGQVDRPSVLYEHDLDQLVIRCDRPLPLQVDGEDLGDVTEAVVECERGAVSVLV